MRQERGAKTPECFLNPSPGKHCWTVFFSPALIKHSLWFTLIPTNTRRLLPLVHSEWALQEKKAPASHPATSPLSKVRHPPRSPPRLQSDVWATKWLIRILIPVRHYSAQTTRSLNRLAAERLGRPRSNGRGGRISETARIERWWLFFTVVTGARVYLLHVCGNKYVIPSSCHPNPTMGANSVDILS